MLTCKVTACFFLGSAFVKQFLSLIEETGMNLRPFM